MMTMTERKVKVVLLGPSLVGKTSIVTAYASDSFETKASPTVAASFVNKIINLGNDRRPIKLQIWDTAGQERFRGLAPMYYRNADVAVIVYSVTDRESFFEVQSWIDELRTQMSKLPLIYIVGNKIDAPNKQVKPHEGEQQANVCGGSFIQTSAKDKTNIEELFWMIASDVYELHGPEMSPGTLDTADTQIRKSCC